MLEQTTGREGVSLFHRCKTYIIYTIIYKGLHLYVIMRMGEQVGCDLVASRTKGL